MSIKENNKLIAEFVGRCGKDKKHLYWVNVEGVQWVTLDEMKFNSSWDWLMPVVEKIHSSMTVKIYGAYRDIRGEEVNVHIHRANQNNRYITLKIEYGRRFKEFTHYKKEGETMLQPTYRFVIDFIKWYNDKSK